MYQLINQRLAELNQQFEQGNDRLLQLERERAELKQTLFRIQGAILVLKDLPADSGRQDRPDNTAQEAAEISIPAIAGDETAVDE